MNVILLERMGSVGDLGDEVTVKAGFARNYLIPQGKAVRATRDNRAEFETRRAELQRAADDRLNQAKGRSAQLEDLTVTLVVKAGEEGKLYGSVGTQDIADAITATGAAVERAEIRMPDGVIRSTGEFAVDVQLHTDLTIPVTVAVVAE